MEIFFYVLLLGLVGQIKSFPSHNVSNISAGLESFQITPTNNTNSSLGGAAVNIVGGFPAERNEFPWLVNLRIGSSFCGGTLIELDLVLTAAHCLVSSGGTPVSPSKITVTAGDHNLIANDDTEQSLTAAWVKPHEDFNSQYLRHDIGLIGLAEKFKYSSSVRPISLPSSSNEEAPRGTAAGWGTIAEDSGQVSPVLYKVNVPVVKGSACESQMSNPNGQFCAGETGKDSCQGDSGGPFICINDPYSVCGIVSYGEGCGRLNKPGVYTKVFSYVSWIDSNRNPPSTSSPPSSSNPPSISTTTPASTSYDPSKSSVAMNIISTYLLILPVLKIVVHL